MSKVEQFQQRVAAATGTALCDRVPGVDGFSVLGAGAIGDRGVSGTLRMMSTDRRYVVNASLSPMESDNADETRRAQCELSISIRDVAPHGLREQTVTIPDYEFHGEDYALHLKELAHSGELLEHWRDGAALAPDQAIPVVPAKHKIGDYVIPRGLATTGRIIEEDTNWDSGGIRRPGETHWYLRFENGDEGGGWPDSTLQSGQHESASKHEKFVEARHFHPMKGHVALDVTVLMADGAKYKVQCDMPGWFLADNKGARMTEPTFDATDFTQRILSLDNTLQEQARLNQKPIDLDDSAAKADRPRLRM